MAESAERQAIVAQAQEWAQLDEWAQEDGVVVPDKESPRWTFATVNGHLVGTLAITSRSIRPEHPYAASWQPISLKADTPLKYETRSSLDQEFAGYANVDPLLAWCRPRLNTASFRDLETRLWLAVYQGEDAKGEEASRLLVQVYTRFHSVEGLKNLLKMCVRSQGGDLEAIVRAGEKMLWTLPKAEAGELARVMGSEYPGWREELKSRWPYDPEVDPDFPREPSWRPGDDGGLGR
jgi:hypothetical protein